MFGIWCVGRANQRLYVLKVDEEARSAAISLLAKGMATPSHVAALAGVSPQLVAYWLKAAGIDWRKAWLRRQAGMWRREIAALNGKVLKSPSKRQLRKIADRAAKQWSDGNGKASPAGKGQPGPKGKGCSSPRAPA